MIFKAYLKLYTTRTVMGESYSAGRLYDKIGDKAKARIFMVSGGWALGKIKIGDDNRDMESKN